MFLQSPEQPSPSSALPSSHNSPAAVSTTWLPQVSSLAQSALQPSPSSGLPSSHVSPGSRTPFPQAGSQSLSVVEFAPSGQQASSFFAAVMGRIKQCKSQFAAEPSKPTSVHRSGCMHVSMAEQLPSQSSCPTSVTPSPQWGPKLRQPTAHPSYEPSLIASSHSSGPSTMPLPHTGGQ